MANIEFERSLQKKVKEYMLLKYEVQRIERVPTKLDATFGEKASSIQAACLFIDIRNSTGLLLKNRSSEVANLLKSFHFICVKTIRENCGEVRSFNGDSSLGIFAESSCCDDAISAALAIKYYINLLIKSKYDIARNLDYGIGVDFGKIFVAKVGISGEFNNDLVWIGEPVNKASRLGNKGGNPNNIIISDAVYAKLCNNNKFRRLLNSGNLSISVPPVPRPPIWKKGFPLLPPNPNSIPLQPIIPAILKRTISLPQTPAMPTNPVSKVYYTNYERPL